jgi:hypothetical protein
MIPLTENDSSTSETNTRIGVEAIIIDLEQIKNEINELKITIRVLTSCKE